MTQTGSRTRWIQVDPLAPDPQLMKEAAVLLRRGGLVAFPTETVYGLGVNREDPQALQELYQIKQRPFDKQVTIHLADALALGRYDVEVPVLAAKLMEAFWPGPLTLVLACKTGSPLGFRLPDHRVARELIRLADAQIIASSANLSGQAPPTTAAAVAEVFEGKIDMIIDAGPTSVGAASTVLSFVEGQPKILRGGAMDDRIKAFLERC